MAIESFGGDQCFKLLSIVGTRPEAIKIAPVALAATRRPRLILTDSGDIQQEAPHSTSLLLSCEVTERPEALATSNPVLVGTDPEQIVAAAHCRLDDPSAHAAMGRSAFSFGRGDAAEKILDGVEQYFPSSPSGEHPLPFRPVWTKDGGPKGA